MRVGIIGTGFIAEVHAGALKACGQEVVAACGNIPEALEAFAKKWGIPREYQDYRDIPLDSLDAVHICTPPNTHYAIVKYFLEKNRKTENGKLAVICEKPLCLDLKEGEELVKLVAESKTPFGVCFHNRFYPAVQKMREIIQGGSLGNVLLVHGSYEQEFHIPPLPYSWRFDAEGGNHLRAVSEIGSHIFDLLRFILKEPVTGVDAVFRNRKEELYRDESGMLWEEKGEGRLPVPMQNEDTAILRLEMQGGTQASISLSEVSFGKLNHMDLHFICEKGRLGWDNDRADKLWISTEKGSTRELNLGMQPGYSDCFREMFADFYKALSEGNVSAMAKVSEAYENEKVCEMCYLSALRTEKRKRKEFLIRHYAMELLEGEHTFYSECYHSPNRNADGKMPVSTMYGLYCKEPRSYSDFHILSHEEIWHFLEGDPFTLYLLYEDGSIETVTLGPDLASGQVLQYTVPVNVIQGACLCPGGEYALYGCTVVPAFTEDCFKTVGKEELQARYGEKKELTEFFRWIKE